MARPIPRADGRINCKPLSKLAATVLFAGAFFHPPQSGADEMDSTRRQPPSGSLLFPAKPVDVVCGEGRVGAAIWRERIVIAVSCLTIFIPFLVVSVPPLVDYPNHLARFWLLAGGARDPVLTAFYRVDWSKASTNIGVDLAVTALSTLARPQSIGFAAAVLAAASPPIGLICLNRAVFHRFHPWQALFPITAWSSTFLMGFLNFQIGVGLALLLAAADPWMRRRLGCLLGPARALVAAFLAVDHLYALLLYAALVFALAIGRAPLWEDRWRALPSRMSTAVIATAWCVAPLLPLAILAPVLPGSDAQSDGLVYGNVAYKVFALLTPLSAYNLVIGLLLMSILVAAAVWLVRQHALRIHAGLALIGAILLGLSVLAPDHAGGGSWIAQRFPTMALLVLLGSARLTPEASKRWALRFAIPVLVLVMAQAAWITWVWRAMDTDMSAVRHVVALVPAGARILPLQHAQTVAGKWSAPPGRYISGISDPTFRHYAALATPLRRAFVPTLFSAKGLQPLQVTGDWDSHVEHNGGPLASINALRRPWRKGDPIYLRGWRLRFDYILVTNADLPDATGAFNPPSGVTLLSNTGFAQLWKIARP
jgi:hypothetical protein